MLKIRIMQIICNLERNMSEIGIVKEFDKLGRIVIPKELRTRYGFVENVEIIATKEGILLKSPEYYLIKKEKQSINFTEK